MIAPHGIVKPSMRLRDRDKNKGRMCLRRIEVRLLYVTVLCALALIAVLVNEFREPTPSWHVASVITLVGYSGCPRFEIARYALRQGVSASPDSISQRVVRMPSEEVYVRWLETRYESKQIMPGFKQSPAVFVRTPNGHQQFLGSTAELIQFLEAKLQSQSNARVFSDRVKLLGNTPVSNNNNERSSDAFFRGSPSDSQDWPSKITTHDETTDMNSEMTSNHIQQTRIATRHKRPSKYLEVPKLSPQIKLKNHIVTGYRVQDGKAFTNYKPLWRYLSDKEQWKFMFQAPMVASHILVQDQLSASMAMKKSKRALINNIGYGGQMCYGGSKAAQMRCRMELAARDGCDYDSLGIQPPQYRMWIKDECVEFFSKVCKAGKEQSLSYGGVFSEVGSSGEDENKGGKEEEKEEEGRRQLNGIGGKASGEKTVLTRNLRTSRGLLSTHDLLLTKEREQGYVVRRRLEGIYGDNEEEEEKEEAVMVNKNRDDEAEDDYAASDPTVLDDVDVATVATDPTIGAGDDTADTTEEGDEKQEEDKQQEEEEEDDDDDDDDDNSNKNVISDMATNSQESRDDKEEEQEQEERNSNWENEPDITSINESQNQDPQDQQVVTASSLDDVTESVTEKAFTLSQKSDELLTPTSTSNDRLWIEKPSGGQHGIGMKVHRGCAKLRKRHGHCRPLPTARKYFVMEYLNPSLLVGHKFDVRSYLVVASLDPLLIFYHDGFARRATHKYSSDVSDSTAHITNSQGQDSKDDHFWDFGRLDEYLGKNTDFPKPFMRGKFREHARKVENFVFQAARSNMYKRKGTYQIFALDWIIDSTGGIHMLEANSNPLVTSYPIPGYPETWETMMELVLKIHTDPVALGDMTVGMNGPKGRTQGSGPGGSRYVYKTWELLFNENEEKTVGGKYNACKVMDPNFQKDEADISEEEDDDEEEELVDTEASNEEHEQEALQQQIEIEESPQKQEMPIVQKAATEATRIHGEGLQVDLVLLKNPEEVVKLDKAAKQAFDTVLNERGQSTFRIDLVKIKKRFRCERTSDDVLECTLAHKTLDETPFWIIASSASLLSSALGENSFRKKTVSDEISVEGRDDVYPVAWVAGGAHGNEVAGIVAAEYIKNNWKPHKGLMIVLPRANIRGTKVGKRYIPGTLKQLQDLNRNFPEDSAQKPIGPLASHIWSLAEMLQPHIFFDLHEGWGFYAQLRLNYDPTRLVGNRKFSKGSSVIATQKAEPIARRMLADVNYLVHNPARPFYSIIPPVSGGLATRLAGTYGTLSVVVETTSSQGIQLRKKQHLVLVAAALRSVGMVPATFKGV